MFENYTFENASQMLEVCRGAFEKYGFAEEARQMKGLEASTLGSTQAALLTLQSIRPRNTETCRALRYTIAALIAVVEPRFEQKAS
jgi:hypothetical protein